MSLNKQNSQGCPGFEEVLQDILDRDTIQTVLDHDNSFSEVDDARLEVSLIFFTPVY